MRLAAVSGFGMTLLFVVLSVFHLPRSKVRGVLPFAWWGAVGGLGPYKILAPFWVGMGKLWTVDRPPFHKLL